ncbi:MAG: hypothetical protein J1F35_07200 [Erysipelotrichales bacterium]|nr:hypothetical protein [Erysipelotrichales bacterium]
MLSIFVRNNILKNIEHQIFTKKDIENYIWEIVNEFELNDYLKDIIFTNDIEHLAFYHFGERTLKINYEEMINDAENNYGKEDKHELVIFTNLYILTSLVHEIVHILQNYYARTSRKPIRIYMKTEILCFSTLTKELYDKYYDCFSFEREAIVTSLEVVLYVIKTKIKNEELYGYFRDWLAESLLSGYIIKHKKLISPAHIISKNVMKISGSYKPKYNIYSKLKYGFDLPYWQYNYFKNNAATIINKKTLHQ